MKPSAFAGIFVFSDALKQVGAGGIIVPVSNWRGLSEPRISRDAGATARRTQPSDVNWLGGKIQDSSNLGLTDRRIVPYVDMGQAGFRR